VARRAVLGVLQLVLRAQLCLDLQLELCLHLGLGVHLGLVGLGLG